MVTEKEFKGATEALHINGTITNVASTFTVKTTPTSNWPTGSSLPFVVTVDRGTALEETMLVGARSGTTFSSITRGYAGTAGVGHSDNATVEHTVDPVALTDMMSAAAQTIGKVTTAEDILVATGSGTFKRLGKGSTGNILQILAGAVAYGALPTGAVSASAMFAAGVVDSSALAPASVIAGKIAVGGVSNANQFAAGVVNSAAILDGTIVDADINASAAIANSKLATNPLARANHTGTQTASTVSDFDTQVRTSRLDQMAAPTAAVSANSQKITSLATPTASTDAATKGYIDGVVPTGFSTYTPVVRQGGSSKSLSVNYAKYVVNGHQCTVWLDLTINASGSGSIDISLPVACDATAGSNTVGLGGIRHFRTLGFSYLAEAFSDTAVSTRCALDFSTLIATQNFASGDNLHGILNYPV